MIFSIAKEVKIGVIICILLIASLLVSVTGVLLGYKELKNNVNLINQKLDEKNNP
jgi:hypothetical protein